MARKHKPDPLKDMFDLISMLPWWMGVAISVIGYLVLHHIATPTLITGSQPSQIAHAVIVGMATVGQYIIPLIGLAGAVTSVFRKK